MSDHGEKFYMMMPEPALRQAIRRAAFETDQPMRRLVKSLLTNGLAEMGYSVEAPPPTQPAKAAAITREQVPS